MPPPADRATAGPAAVATTSPSREPAAPQTAVGRRAEPPPRLGEAAASFDELYRRYSHRLAAYGARLLGASGVEEPADDPQERSTARGMLVGALTALPERQRYAYLLREVRGLRIAEIAVALELTTA